MGYAQKLISVGKIPVIRNGKAMYINFTGLVEQLNNRQGDIWER
jgi:hypothetical protein